MTLESKKWALVSVTKAERVYFPHPNTGEITKSVIWSPFELENRKWTLLQRETRKFSLSQSRVVYRKKCK